MRESETTSSVIWPTWCYSGIGDLDPKHRVRMNGPSPLTGNTAVDFLNNNTTNNNNNNSSISASDRQHSTGTVKAERLSPPTGDNNSTSSRSGTPVSSYEGATSLERGSPLSNPLKVMEQATSRNYSDFMRSLAAKYNHANPNDYFSGASTAPNHRSNGTTPFAGGGDPRTASAFSAAFKAGLIAPLAAGVATPASVGSQGGAGAAPLSKETAESGKPTEAATATEAVGNRWSFGGATPFAAPVPPVYPGGIDMSSTQALINMVRTASAQSANQLETYLKGIKRGADNPLDLSATKKVRKSGAGLSLSESLYGDALLGLPMLSALNRASKELLPITHRLQTKSPKPVRPGGPNSNVSKNSLSNSVSGRPQCLSLCNDKDRPCASGLTNSGGANGGGDDDTSPGNSSSQISSWSVEEVASFVESIDICAEYAGNFREQRIDGSALPLLTEQHLTTALQMKLGPALKLRAVLSARIGQCASCLHCIHCHGNQQQLPPSSPSPKPLVRPSSTGN